MQHTQGRARPSDGLARNSNEMHPKGLDTNSMAVEWLTIMFRLFARVRKRHIWKPMQNKRSPYSNLLTHACQKKNNLNRVELMIVITNHTYPPGQTYYHVKYVQPGVGAWNQQMNISWQRWPEVKIPHKTSGGNWRRNQNRHVETQYRII